MKNGIKRGLSVSIMMMLCVAHLGAYTVMTRCEDVQNRVKRNRNTFALFYDGFTGKKKNILRRIEDDYRDLDINFIAVDVSNPELRRCVNELGVQDFPSFTLFDHAGSTKVAADDPSEDRLKRILNEELSTQKDNAKYYNNEMFKLAQSYDRNWVTQGVVPNTFQATYPAYKNIMPSSFSEHFPPPDCFSQCLPCDACADKHGVIPSGGCGGCDGCGRGG